MEPVISFTSVLSAFHPVSQAFFRKDLKMSNSNGSFRAPIRLPQNGGMFCFL